MHQIQILKYFSSHRAVVFAESTEAMCEVETEDVVGAVPTGDASITSEWSSIVMPTQIWAHFWDVFN